MYVCIYMYVHIHVCAYMCIRMDTYVYTDKHIDGMSQYIQINIFCTDVHICTKIPIFEASPII
jgi:hypothetical protein